MNQIREEFRKLRLEIDQIKLDMCTKEQFSRLEVRVQKLEVQGPKNPQIDFLKQNLAKLDPANRSCCLNSFEENDAVIRTALIEKMLVDNGGFEKETVSPSWYVMSLYP